MTISFLRRRLVVTVVPAPRQPDAALLSAAVGATDAELARLAAPPYDLDRARWTAGAMLEGARLF